MKLQFPDYEHCPANLTCSILQHFGVHPPHPTLAAADTFLQKRWKNVVVILLDAMGIENMEYLLEPDGFLRSHLRTEYSSVFPTTTVAATTAQQSGLHPNESGWLAWSGYFPALDKNVHYFRSKSLSQQHYPYTNAVTQITAHGGQAYLLDPYHEPFPQTMDAMCKEIEHLCALPEEKYIDVYFPEPDATMHRKGCESAQTREILQAIEQRIAEMTERLSDTLLLITADHGQVNIDNYTLTDYPDITECLVRMPSFDPRALNFFVKDGMHEQFRSAFLKHFGEEFKLLTKAEVMEQQLLGTGTPHPDFSAMIGDFLAFGTGRAAIANTPEENQHFISAHSGMTAAEMRIPLIAVEIP